jgi:hypothetical protein
VNEIYLRNVVGFFPNLGFSQDKSLCVLYVSCLCCYCSVHDIYVNGNEVKEN